MHWLNSAGASPTYQAGIEDRFDICNCLCQPMCLLGWHSGALQHVCDTLRPAYVPCTSLLARQDCALSQLFLEENLISTTEDSVKRCNTPLRNISVIHVLQKEKQVCGRADLHCVKWWVFKKYRTGISFSTMISA